MIKVSVIIPVYNVELYLRECLDSIINQTLKEIEIICIDDNSTDNSYSILEEYSKKDSRIFLLRNNENMGIGYTRNFGQKQAKGDYIYFVDPDDYISLNFLEDLYNTAKKYDVDIVNTNNAYHIFEPDKKIELIWCSYNINKSSDYLVEMNFDNFQPTNNSYRIHFTLWTKLFRRDFLISNNIFSPESREGIAYDADFVFRALLYCPSGAFNNKAIYFYRKHSQSIVANINSKGSRIKYMLDNYTNTIKLFEKVNIRLINDLYIHILDSILFTISNISLKEGVFIFPIIKDFVSNIFIDFNLKNKSIDFYSNLEREYMLIRASTNYDNYLFNKRLLINFMTVDDKLNELDNKLNMNNSWFRLFGFNKYGHYTILILFGIRIIIKNKRYNNL